MKEQKRLKDPIYGYIDMPSKIMNQIVDTAVFQRLRRIAQTSYSPLYSSAVHNRFVHSLGVYYLGTIAARSIQKEIKAALERDCLELEFALDRFVEVFLLACLLHDVGHAPFSHTGEAFYLDGAEDYSRLHDLLNHCVGCPDLERDICGMSSKFAAPHEIMSAIVGLKEFSAFFNSMEERAFFARCITGYKYLGVSTGESVKNCFVFLLNSKIIDVDKLDYLIRDAFVTGFNTVQIDYERLLTSMTVAPAGHNPERYEPAYYKGAISVIENVVYAHDAERKWIQSHPVILYESYILQHIMSSISSKMDGEGKKLFSLDSLSVKGQQFSSGLQIRLLCDDDLVVLMKNSYMENEMIQEYFERRKRRHPIWKSEAEYKVLFRTLDHDEKLLDKLESAMDSITMYINLSSSSFAINEELIQKVQQDLEDIDALDLNAHSKKIQKSNKAEMLAVMNCLKEYAAELGIPCSFVLLKSSQFNSGFSKPDFSATKIVFPASGKNQVARFGDVVSSIEGKEQPKDHFFYLFYQRTEGTAALDSAELCRRLFKAML